MTAKRRIKIPLQPGAEAAADLEIQNHIAEATDRLVADGWNESDARAEAERRFGNVRRVRGTMVRETRTIERNASLWDFLMSIPADVRYAWRALVRNPLFAVVVIATLGLGMGAAATAFTVVDALLLRPLPYLEPERMVEVQVISPSGVTLPLLTKARIDALEAGTPALSEFAWYDHLTFTMTGEKEAAEVPALLVSPDMDEMLGVRPHLGRGFDVEDAKPGVHRAMMTYDFWRKRGADRNVVGTTIRLDGTPYEVVGVLPRRLKFPIAGTPKSLWVAMPADLVVKGNTLPWVHGVGRLAPDMTFESADARLSALAPAPGAEEGIASFPLELSPVGRWRGNPELVRGVWLIVGAVGLMLLVALVNAMNLILFRGADRTRELAVRLALGVSKLQLMRHILVENVVISLLSGAAAVVIAVAGTAAVNRRLPEEFAFSSAYTFDVSGRVLLFAFVLACSIGLVLGMLPLIRALRMRLAAGQIASARGTTRGDARIARTLVVAEVALAVSLLAGAGLLATSFNRLTRVDPGLDTDRIAFASINLPSKYASSEARAAFYNRLEAELESRPEIEAATISVGAPPNVGFSFGVKLQAEGGEPLPVAKDDPALLPSIMATPDFVETAGMTLVAGRDLDASDVGTQNVLVDAKLAEALWGGVVAGRRFRTNEDDPWRTAVGVYRHMHAMGFDDRQAQYGMIRPRNPNHAESYMSVIVRPRGDPDAVLPVVRQVMNALDPDVPLSRLATARAAFSETVDKPRFLARVMAGISAVALILAAIGIYGVLSYAVARRRREMGIRMAIGAAPLRLGWLFLREGMLLTLAGVVLGLVMGYWLVGYSRVLLYGLEPTDPTSYALAAVVVLVVAAIASVLPARVVGTMSPATVLRSE